MINLIPLWAVFGYWKDLNQLLVDINDTGKHYELINSIENYMIEQLRTDYYNYEMGNEVSLLAKYVGKEHRSFDKKIGIAKRLAKRMFPEDWKYSKGRALRKYRKMYAPLNKHINTTEIYMCNNGWDMIDFKCVPSICLNKNRKAFLDIDKHNVRRHKCNYIREACRDNFMETVNSGKINSKMLFLHEIVKKVINGNLSKEEEQLIIAQWEGHMKEFNSNAFGKCICLVDVSGSMCGTPMEVAIAMGIFAPSITHPLFRDRVLTFEYNPNWVILRYPNKIQYDTHRYYSTNLTWDIARIGGELTVIEKINILTNSPWGGTTDFVAAHDLILSHMVKYNIPANEIPDKFFIFSDMQFNSATNSYGYYNNITKYIPNLRNFIKKNSRWDTIHECLSEAYYQAGIESIGEPYIVPQQIYWNLRGDTIGFPVDQHTPNTQMISGFNTSLFKLFLTDDLDSYTEQTPYDTMRLALDNECYDTVRYIFDDVYVKKISPAPEPGVDDRISPEPEVNCIGGAWDIVQHH